MKSRSLLSPGLAIPNGFCKPEMTGTQLYTWLSGSAVTDDCSGKFVGVGWLTGVEVTSIFSGAEVISVGMEGTLVALGATRVYEDVGKMAVGVLFVGITLQATNNIRKTPKVIKRGNRLLFHPVFGVNDIFFVIGRIIPLARHHAVEIIHVFLDNFRWTQLDKQVGPKPDDSRVVNRS